MKNLLYSLVLLASAPTSFGALTLYTDRATWQAALTGVPVTQDFNSVASDILFQTTTTIGGIVINQSGTEGDSILDVSPFENNPLPTSGIDGTPLLSVGGLMDGGSLDIILPMLVSSFGFDTNNFDYDDEDAIFSIGGTVVGAIPANRGELGFVGVIADTPADFFTTISASSPGSQGTYFSLDNLSYSPATTSAIPEPTGVVTLSCLLALGFFSRSRR